MIEQETPIPNDFGLWVKKSIGVLGSLGKIMDDRAAAELLISHGVSEREAMNIVTFVPIAFVRKLLPQIKWPISYIEARGERRVEKLFSNNRRYSIVEKETNAYWTENPKKEIVLNVAGRSAEFQAINNLVLQGGRLEDIQLTNVVISIE